MSEHNFIDTSEEWGVVTDHVDWFTAQALQNKKWFFWRVNTTYLYVFTHDRFFAYIWQAFDKGMPKNNRGFQNFVDQEIANHSSKTLLFEKSKIETFQIEHIPGGSSHSSNLKILINIAYGNRQYEFYHYELPNDWAIRYTQNLHARLLRGLNRKLRPFGQTKVTASDHSEDADDKMSKRLPGELEKINI